ncbi:MAG: polyprenyl synthetase family protein [Candidatus Bathyarchaeota archaeon]|nr:polyprenyl synthetase family protein [Candidatus Bathyarchaeum sp.]
MKQLKQPLEFISKNWRDPLTPALMKLSCEAVGGQAENTYDVAVSLSLMNLSFYVWDDMVDKTTYKSFKPTLFGKFGEGPALIIGGLASAKAFSILNEMNTDIQKRQIITQLIWNLWAKMATAEKVNVRSRRQCSSSDKLWVFTTEAADLETCLKLGAILGEGSDEEVKQLGRYGLNIGIILELWKDFLVSINLTFELAEKIRANRLPYSLLVAMEHSENLRKNIEKLANIESIQPSDIKQVVEQVIATEQLKNIITHIEKSAKEAKNSLLGLDANEATEKLGMFAEAQPRLFIESLSVLQT